MFGKATAMKKHFITALLLMLCLAAKSQSKDTIPNIDVNYEYSGIVRLDTSFKKDEIYRSAKAYFGNNFSSANGVIQYQSREEGKLIGKGFFEIHYALSETDIKWTVSYTTSIECKEGKYRLRIYDIAIHQLMLSLPPPGKKVDEEQLSIDDAVIQARKGNYQLPSIKLLNQMLDRFKATPLLIKRYIETSHLAG